MKYIHSLWSDPYKKYENGLFEFNSQSFATRNFIYFFLSALLIKKLGHTIDLYCDKESYELYSNIPYDNINIVNFNDDNIDPQYWIWSKIKTQKLINEPYIHIDGDVFFFEDIIKNNLKNEKFIVQSIENEETMKWCFFDTYLKDINIIASIISDKNIEWYKYGMQAYNCGVIGFNDMSLKNIYITKMEEILKNLDVSSKLYRYNPIFMVIEQAMLYYLMKENNEKPFEVLKYEDIIKFDCDYDLLGKKMGYAHLLGHVKDKPETAKKVKNKLFKLFPETKKIIKNVESKYKI